MNALDFLNSRFRISFKKKTGEANFPCPRCGHNQFYFNVYKRLGHCKRASCHWSPTLKDLIQFVGSSVNVDLEDSPAPKQEKVPVALPPDSVPILSRELFSHCSRCETVAEYLERDRNISRQKIYQYDIHETENRIYVPVYFNGELVNYVGRLKWWYTVTNGQRYKYASGTSTSAYLFDWDRAKFLKQLTLVENTFNAIWLSEFGVTTNFGSSLSSEQIDLIANSGIKSVCLVWDEGAESSAEKSVVRLKDSGVKAIYLKILGQPDNHKIDCIQNMIRLGHSQAETGKVLSLNIKHPTGDCSWEKIKI